MREHAAPWGKILVATSLFASLLCAGVAVLMWVQIRRDEGDAVAWVALLPLVVVGIAALFTIRGYTVTADEILIRRAFWATRLPRNRLESATADPAALRGSIRLFGNGGMFAFSGWFRSASLGKYRAFVTDPARSVILRFSDRVVVVSPGDPAAFIRDVSPRR